jgi:hypothetical protein
MNAPGNLLGPFIFPQPDKLGMTQVTIRRPFGELDLDDQLPVLGQRRLDLIDENSIECPTSKSMQSDMMRIVEFSIGEKRTGHSPKNSACDQNQKRAQSGK